MATTKFELSKTYQYRKVMKPILERKRRARINDCLDELRELMVDCMQQQRQQQQQQQQESPLKLDKVDVLELTVQYLRKMKFERQQLQQQQQQQQQLTQHNNNTENNFRSGYIKAVSEVSRSLAAMPNMDLAVGTKLMTQLGLRLNQLESANEIHTAVNEPLSINTNHNVGYLYHRARRCSSTNESRSDVASMSSCSPVSSGYASDSDYSPACPKQSLLQIATPVWRPW